MSAYLQLVGNIPITQSMSDWILTQDVNRRVL